MPAARVVYPIGHSTRTFGEFLELLNAHGIRQITDVRRFPVSQRLPHFNREPFAEHLSRHGIEYRHMPELGGRRRPRPDSPNGGWREPGFRAYADYMETPAFSQGLAELRRYAEYAPTSIMCAEAVWWRCHRRLIADALVRVGVEVRHILSAAPAPPHEITSFAVDRNGGLRYPDLLAMDESS